MKGLLALLALGCLVSCGSATVDAEKNAEKGKQAMAEEAGFGRRNGEELLLSSTIDFLDYAFYDKACAGKEYYDLESYEEQIRRMAEGGLKRIYLRTNACGLCNYPTKVSAMYGEDGRLHWNDLENAKRFAETLRRYDPCKETIRLGHKYGMEVWCWESLCDEFGSPIACREPEFAEAARRVDWAPLLEPAYAIHPEWQAKRRPDLLLSAEQQAAINEQARRYPVAKIVVKDSNPNGGEIRILPEEVEIYVSEDNIRYDRYAGDFRCRAYRDEEKRKCFEIDGLNITSRYVKLAHPTYEDKKWGIAVNVPRGLSCAYNTKGEKIQTVWSTIYDRGSTKEGTGFNFRQFSSAAWDYSNYQVGFCVGEPEMNDAYYQGVAEFALPAAREFKLRKFAEVAAYDFDGYMINLRTHSSVAKVEEYGFNPEVIKMTMERCGKDPTTDEDALKTLLQIRAEGIAEYLKGCKKLIGDRRLYISGLPNKPENRANAEDKHYQKKYGALEWLYDRYFADGSVDGVIMMGSDFRDEFTPEVLHGRRIKLGVFREMAYASVRENLKDDIARLRADADIDEVELYETMMLSFHPEMFDLLKP